jgi:hypothetical protein
MFYVKPASFNNVSYSVEHVAQFYWCLTTFNNVSGITYNMLASFIGV